MPYCFMQDVDSSVLHPSKVSTFTRRILYLMKFDEKKLVSIDFMSYRPLLYIKYDNMILKAFIAVKLVY